MKSLTESGNLIAVLQRLVEGDPEAALGPNHQSQKVHEPGLDAITVRLEDGFGVASERRYQGSVDQRSSVNVLYEVIHDLGRSEPSVIELQGEWQIPMD